MSHTPGPWTLLRDRVGAPESVWGKGTCVCEFGIDAPKPEDARLIAAAPELLEVIREAMDSAEREMAKGRKASPGLATWLEKVRAALAKVRGEAE